MRTLLLLFAGLAVAQAGWAATNELRPLRTNFVSGASLSTGELDTVVRLANLCGIRKVVEVSTERHLGETTIQAAGDEKFEGQSVIFKTVQIYPNGSRRVRPVDSPFLGGFWAESAKPEQQERTIVRIGDREVRVGLLNGITPAGADKIIDAFVKRRVRGVALTGVDVTQPSWIGISGGKPYIIFASSPLERFTFTLEGDRVTIADRIQVYE